MGYPRYCGEELAAADPVTLSRERELSFLLYSAFTAMLARNRVAGALSSTLCIGTVRA
jgi:hypothetical protein